MTGILVLGDAPDLSTWQRHNYVDRLLAMLERGELALMPGQITHVDVYHDADCPALSGAVGDCDCDATVTVRGDPQNS